jgi:hypothetical protein
MTFVGVRPMLPGSINSPTVRFGFSTRDVPGLELTTVTWETRYTWIAFNGEVTPLFCHGLAGFQLGGTTIMPRENFDRGRWPNWLVDLAVIRSKRCCSWPKRDARVTSPKKPLSDGRPKVYCGLSTHLSSMALIPFGSFISYIIVCTRIHLTEEKESLVTMGEHPTRCWIKTRSAGPVMLRRNANLISC